MAHWSPDGSQLAVTRGTATGQELEYPIGKKIFESDGSIFTIKVSPKGDRIAFVNNPTAQDSGGYATIVDADGSNRIASRKWSFVNGLAWSPDGSEVWFAAGQHPLIAQIYAMDLKGHERMIASLPGNFVLCNIAADGRVLLLHQSPSNSIFVHLPGSTEDRDLYWHDISLAYAISSDGKKILFSEGGDAAYQAKDWPAYVRSTDGAPAIRLGEGYPIAFSPDGNWAMVNPRADPSQFLALPLHAGEAHPLTADAIHHVNGRWLPDGKRIVFVGAEPRHRARYYVQDSMQATPRAISGEDITFDPAADDIVVSANGRMLAAAMQNQTVELLPLDGGPARVVPGVTGLTPVGFCGDDSLLVYHAGEMPAHIVPVELKTARQTPWRDLAPAYRTALWGVQPIRVTPDCESYAYNAQYLPGTLFVASGLR